MALQIPLPEELPALTALPTWAPSVDNVAALMPTRFPRRSDGSSGPSPDTRPTAEQLATVIGLLAPDLLEDVSLEDWGDDSFTADALSIVAPSSYAGNPVIWAARQRVAVAKLARTALAFRVAALVENGFFPEQNADGTGGPAEFFRRRAQEQTDRLRRKLVTLGRADLPRA